MKAYRYAICAISTNTKDNMLHYKKYIHDRLSTNHPSISVIEEYASYAAHRHSGNDDFRILIFTDKECYDCTCVVDSQKRFMIKSMQCIEHNLDKIYGDDITKNGTVKKYELAYFAHDGQIDYDEYYNIHFQEIADYDHSVKEALRMIGSESPLTTYIAGDFTNYKAVKYNIDGKVGKTTWIDSQESTGTKSKILFSPKLMSEKININVKGASMIDLIRQKGISVYIPNNTDTLNSRFTSTTKWSDIIPINCVKCSIGSTECHYVTISLEVDAFNNLFCVTEDASGNKKTTLIYSHIPISLPTEVHTQKEIPPKNDPIKSESSPEDVLSETAHCTSDHTDIQPDTVSHTIENSSSEDINGNDLQRRFISIEDGKVCTFYDLFGDYLKGVEEMRIEDPYIYRWHQFNNLRDLIAASFRINNESKSNLLKKVHLVTQAPSKEYKVKGKTINLQEATTRHKRDLEKFSKELKSAGIIFTYEYNDIIHDRCITLSNGWYISIGRGLDIFKPAENIFSERKCHKTDIHIVRTEDKLDVIRKKRK